MTPEDFVEYAKGYLQALILTGQSEHLLAPLLKAAESVEIEDDLILDYDEEEFVESNFPGIDIFPSDGFYRSDTGTVTFNTGSSTLNFIETF